MLGRTPRVKGSLVLVFLVLLGTLARTDIRHRFWRRVPDLDNLRFQDGELRRMVTGGKTQCSMACSQEPSCLAFSVQDRTKQCVLLDQSPSPLAKAVPAEGFRYYVPDEGECQSSRGLALLPGPLCMLLVTSPVPAQRARSGCRERGLRLLSLDTRWKMDIFKDYVTIKGEKSKFAWFVGLQYNSQTDSWVWENGQPMDPSLWGEGEPTNTNQGCYLPFEPNVTGIHDSWPSNSFPFACEMPLPP